MNIQEVINRLKEGNTRFVSNNAEGKLQDLSRRQHLIKGQQPFAIVLSCADSRIVPEMAFDVGLGEIFVVRVAGNVANTSSIASIEYAVAHLDTQVIVVLAHQNCGAVTAAVSGGDNGNNLNHLLAHIDPALQIADDKASVDDISKINAELTVEELKNKSSIISAAVNKGKLKIVSAYYHLESGEVDFLN